MFLIFTRPKECLRIPTNLYFILCPYFVFQKVCMKTGNDTGFDVTMKDVYDEFSQKIVDRYKIAKFKSKVR